MPTQLEIDAAVAVLVAVMDKLEEEETEEEE
jgi:hypothetical protein